MRTKVAHLAELVRHKMQTRILASNIELTLNDLPLGSDIHKRLRMSQDELSVVVLELEAIYHTLDQNGY